MKKVGIAVAMAWAALVGCSEQTNSVPDNPSQSVPRSAQLDEGGLIAAVGSPVTSEYVLDDGKGVSFHGQKCGKRVCGPEFSLEFRQGRVNVYWENFRDGGGKTFEAQNAENLLWANQVLTYALGEDAAKKILENQKNGLPIRDEKFLGQRVGMSPGETSTLVQIYQ